jgi:transcriptional regulator of acetoin/glycerol metabolism
MPALNAYTVSAAPSATAAFADCDIANNSDPQVRQAFNRALRLMERGIAVLIQGETGTGKEVLARALHEHSRRRNAELVALNCASIPETLIESELFGYSKGAFSGASANGKKGKVVQADGGTLFLDEIGDMPHEQQTRLLRVIAEREVTPLGAERSIPVNFALVCATHQNLNSMVERGEFREDLFYRIATGVVQLPALRERTDRDELILAMVASELPGRDPRQAIAADVWQTLMRHSWPGNLRQMRAVIRYACAVMDGAVISRCDLPADFLAQGLREPRLAAALNVTPIRQAKAVAPAQDERQNVLGVLNECRWNMTAAARALGICRPSLYRVLRRLDIAPLRDQLAQDGYSLA